MGIFEEIILNILADKMKFTYQINLLQINFHELSLHNFVVV